ncbi:MAG: hypothetical protein JST54_22800 [Deltaproteobacteria bacterium]|nr:hypothetical protein [Deltaproteobacteria bacterium]
MLALPLLLPLVALAAPTTCAVAGRSHELAAAFRKGNTSRSEDLNAAAPIFAVGYDEACAAQAVAWLGSDDPTERLAGAAYFTRFRVKSWHTESFLLFFHQDVPDLNDFELKPGDREKWDAQASKEVSQAVVEAKMSLLFGWFPKSEEAARYMLDAKKVIAHDMWTMVHLKDSLDWSPGIVLRPDDLDFLWAHRDDSSYAFGEMHAILAAHHDPREKKLVQSTFSKRPFKDLHDRDDLLERAYMLGLGDRAMPELVRLAKRDLAKNELCESLDAFVRTASGHLPSMLAVLQLAPDCKTEMMSGLGAAVRATPDPEAALIAVLPSMERQLGDKMWVFGLPECIKALPPEPRPSTLRAIAEAVSRHDPHPILGDLEELAEARKKTASESEKAELEVLLADLRGRKLEALYQVPVPPEPPKIERTEWLDHAPMGWQLDRVPASR